jgi:hypothetical protein
MAWYLKIKPRDNFKAVRTPDRSLIYYHGLSSVTACEASVWRDVSLVSV